MIRFTPVILCGGSCFRLWQLSRTGYPAQISSLTGNESLFQQTAEYLSQLCNADFAVENPIIVTGDERRFLASEQMREEGIELGCSLLEPAGRNTAPALTLAVLAAMVGTGSVLGVATADQTVANSDDFNTAIRGAVQETVTEHWVVVKGTFEITNDDQVLISTENQLTYIPLGEAQKLANLGITPLKIIEVHSGAYSGGDDIVRFEYGYGRAVVDGLLATHQRDIEGE